MPDLFRYQTNLSGINWVTHCAPKGVSRMGVAKQLGKVLISLDSGIRRSDESALNHRFLRNSENHVSHDAPGIMRLKSLIPGYNG